MADMQAFKFHRFGGPDVLKLATVPIPELNAHEVLIRVRAASVNPVDYKTREGKYPAVREDKLPFTPGRDFAGIVERSNSPNWEAGQKVYGFVGQGQGAYAQFVKVDASALAALPASLDFLSGAAVPLAALTGWQGIFDHGGLTRGQSVLIHAAAGGVGHFAVQFAKARGAQVFATASTDSVEFVRSLGADRVIDYKKERFEDIARDMDVIFDTLGGETQARSWNALKDGGALISTLEEPSKELAEKHHARVARFTARPDGEQLREIGALIDARSVVVKLAETFRFDQALAALARVEQGHVHGKVVIEMPD